MPNLLVCKVRGVLCKFKLCANCGHVWGAMSIAPRGMRCNEGQVLRENMYSGSRPSLDRASRSYCLRLCEHVCRGGTPVRPLRSSWSGWQS